VLENSWSLLYSPQKKKANLPEEIRVTLPTFAKSCLYVALSASAFLGTVNADVHYKIDLRSPEHHSATVEVQFPQTKSNTLKVNLPMWRTGKYQMLPLADGIRKFSATDSQGKSLKWQRLGSGEWQVELEKPTPVTVSYQLYANDLGLRVRDINATHAFLDASGVFMYSPSSQAEPLSVSLQVPTGWKSYSGMEKGSTNQEQVHVFKADNYHVLVDSPIETGINTAYDFNADGREYQAVFWGEGNYDSQKIVADLTKISAQAKRIWSGFPFERYVYMIHATSGEKGATEHLNSTVIQLPRFNFREREDYLRFISTASHEFIHTWNVKAYRPQGLVPYDYQAENLTSLLWIAEGSTSYFQNQFLLSAGIMTAKEFLQDLAKRIDANLKTPGKAMQSVAEASLGQWTSTGGDYAMNHSVNIYSEGYFASLSLDFTLLEDSGLKHSYRDVHRALYADFKLPKAYGVNDVKGILTSLTGKDYQAWWQQNVDSPMSLDFDTLLNKAGLKLQYGKKAKTTVDAGMSLTGVHGDLTLGHVSKDGPAWQAGLTAGDEIVAINGLKVTSEGFNKRLEDFNAGDTMTLSVFKQQQLQQVTLTLAEQAKGDAMLVSVAKPSAAQKAFYKAWLGMDWPFDDKGELLSSDDAAV
jgi:predicted metalloprotease with PDZ domain